jgi:hypothetical protein
MAWEVRKGRRYFYRSKRLPDGRVVKTYHGDGIAGAIAADFDRLKRLERNFAVACHLLLLEEISRVADPVSELCRVGDTILEAALLAAGYYRRRGEWRKRHGTDNDHATAG